MLGAGYLMTSIEDLGHYLIAQMNGGKHQDRSVLSAQGMAAMHQPPQLPAGQSPYGMGWMSYTQDGVLHLNHNGQSASFTCSMILLPERDWGLAVLANVSGMLPPHAAWSLADSLDRMVSSGQPAQVDPAFRSFQVPWVGGFLLATIFIVWSLTGGLYRWRKKLRAQPPGSRREMIRRIVLPVCGDGALALLAFFGPLLFLGTYRWRGMFVWQPDAVYWCLAMGILLLIKIALRVRIAAAR